MELEKEGGFEDPCTIHAVHLLSPREVTSKEGKQILKGKGVALLVTNTKWCSFPLQGLTASRHASMWPASCLNAKVHGLLLSSQRSGTYLSTCIYMLSNC